MGGIIPQAVGAPNLPQLPAQPPTGAGPHRQPPRDWPQSRTISDLEALWEVPANPKGVLFVAHGCNHAATDWWPASPRCPTCVGLPEERAIRKAALRRGYAVLAVSSFDRDTQCWHNTGSPADSADLQRLPDVLRWVVKEEGLGSLPLFAFGASSGGGIVLRLAGIMAEVQGVIAQIVPGRPDLLQAQDGRRFPPVLFVHMAQRDPGFAAQVWEALEYCRQQGIPAGEIRVDPRPLTPAFLRRTQLVDAEQATSVLAALRDVGLTDKEGFVLESPRSNPARGQWEEALVPVLGDGRGRELWTLHVAELLNVAYAQHEITSDSTAVSLAWLEAGGQTTVLELQEQEQQRQQEKRQKPQPQKVLL